MFDQPNTTIDSTVEELRQRCYEQEQIIEQLASVLTVWISDELQLKDIDDGEPLDTSTLIEDTISALCLAEDGRLQE